MAPILPQFLAHTGTSRLAHWQPGIARHTPRTGTGNERRARAACGTRRARAPATCGAPPHAPAYVVRIGHRGSEQDQRRKFCACHICAGGVRARSASGSAGDWFWVGGATGVPVACRCGRRLGPRGDWFLLCPSSQGVRAAHRPVGCCRPAENTCVRPGRTHSSIAARRN